MHAASGYGKTVLIDDWQRVELILASAVQSIDGDGIVNYTA